MSDESKSIKIKPSIIPYVWKEFTLIVLGLVVYVALSAASLTLLTLGPLVSIVALALIGLGLLGVLVGAVQRNMFTYLISDRDMVVQKQLFRRSVRRIPFSSISDLQVSQTIIGRLAGYGNIAPITKSGYGVMRVRDRAESVVQEMINVPNPNKVADLIMTKVSTTTGARSDA